MNETRRTSTPQNPRPLCRRVSGRYPTRVSLVPPRVPSHWVPYDGLGLAVTEPRPRLAYPPPSWPLRVTLRSVRSRSPASLALPFALRSPSFRDRLVCRSGSPVRTSQVVVVSRQGLFRRVTCDGASQVSVVKVQPPLRIREVRFAPQALVTAPKGEYLVGGGASDFAPVRVDCLAFVVGVRAYFTSGALAPSSAEAASVPGLYYPIPYKNIKTRGVPRRQVSVCVPFVTSSG